MSNSNIASRILEAIAAFERGEVSATAIAQSIELHEPALEAVPRDIRDRLHLLSVKAIEQDLSPLEEEVLGICATKEAVNELKMMLEAIRGLHALNVLAPNWSLHTDAHASHGRR